MVGRPVTGHGSWEMSGQRSAPAGRTGISPWPSPSPHQPSHGLPAFRTGSRTEAQNTAQLHCTPVGIGVQAGLRPGSHHWYWQPLVRTPKWGICSLSQPVAVRYRTVSGQVVLQPGVGIGQSVRMSWSAAPVIPPVARNGNA